MSGQDPEQKPKPGLLNRLLGSSKKPALHKPAYYADGGALMGTVVELVEDEKTDSSSYVVETDYGERMRFPVEQFEITERGLIYRPLWKEALHKQIDELEERIRASETGDSFVISRILEMDSVDSASLKALINRHPDQSEVFEAFAGLVALYRELRQRYEVLEVERVRARSDLSMHAGERLLKHKSRREFAKLVLAERRRYQICDINLKHVRELLDRLHDSPYFPSQLFPPLELDEDRAAEDELLGLTKPPRPSRATTRPTGKPPELPATPAATEPETSPNPSPVAAAQAPTPQETPRHRSPPRVTFTPPPSQLRSPTPEATEAAPEAAAPATPPPLRAPQTPGPTTPRQAMANYQHRQTGGSNRPKPVRHRSGGGLASQFQGFISQGSSPASPIKVTSPGVATSMLSFVNEVSKGGVKPARASKRHGAGQALVLNLNAKGHYSH